MFRNARNILSHTKQKIYTRYQVHKKKIKRKQKQNNDDHRSCTRVVLTSGVEFSEGYLRELLGELVHVRHQLAALAAVGRHDYRGKTRATQGWGERGHVSEERVSLHRVTSVLK